MEQLGFSISVTPNLSAVLHFCVLLKRDFLYLAMPGVSLICAVFLRVTISDQTLEAELSS